MDTDEARRAIRQIIERCHTSTLVTVDASGKPWARQMSDHNDGAGSTLWLQTSARTQKIRHLASCEDAGLYYFLSDKRRYVYVSGTCRAVDDPALRKKHFRKTLYEYWPDGPTDPDYVLLRFDADGFVYYPGSQVGHFPVRIDAGD